MKRRLLSVYLLPIIGILLLGSRCECPTQPLDIRIVLSYPRANQIVVTPAVLFDYYVTGTQHGSPVDARIDTEVHLDDNEDGIYEVYSNREYVPVNPSTTYHWFVRARGDGRSESETSEVRTFTTSASFVDTGQVYDPVPDSGAVAVDSVPVYSWRVFSPMIYSGPTYEYDFYFGTTTDPPLVQAGLVSRWYRPDDTLAGNTKYYWRVVSFPSSGDSIVGSLWEFTTIAADMPSVSNPNPAHGAFDVDSAVTLTWDYADPTGGPTQFDVYLGESTDPPLVASGLTSASYTPAILAGGTDYFWRVVIYNAFDTVSSPEWNFTTIYSESEDVFALFDLAAIQTPTGYHIQENYFARFDSELAPLAPINPLQAGGVNIAGVDLNWESTGEYYSYENWSMPLMENGQPVAIEVTGNTDVPALLTSFDFPVCSLSITYPIGTVDNVSLSGFEVLWDGSDGGTVLLVLMNGSDSTGVVKEVPNDGADSLTAADLAPLGGASGSYDLYVIKTYAENIHAPGYVPGSMIRIQVMNRSVQVSVL